MVKNLLKTKKTLQQKEPYLLKLIPYSSSSAASPSQPSSSFLDLSMQSLIRMYNGNNVPITKNVNVSTELRMFAQPSKNLPKFCRSRRSPVRPTADARPMSRQNSKKILVRPSLKLSQGFLSYILLPSLRQQPHFLKGLVD